MYTLNVVMRAAIGIEFPIGGHSMNDVLEAFHVFSRGITSPGLNLPFSQFRKSLEARKRLEDILQGVRCEESNWQI